MYTSKRKPKKFIERTDITNLSVESMIENCTIEIPKYNLLIIVMYWPNSSRAGDTFYTRLKDILSLIMMKDKNKSMVLGGDLNIDFLTNNKQMRTLSNQVRSNNF